MILKATFVVLVLCVTYSTALDSLCSNDVFDNKCICKKYTNGQTNLPTSLANCNGLNMDTFPEFSQLPNDLTALDLSMNAIQILDYSSGTTSGTLKKLILSYNGIIDVSADFLKGFPALNVLDLSYNNLSALSDELFMHQKSLVYLDLSYNNIKELPSAIFDPMPLLQTLALSYNPLGEFLMRSKDVLSRTLGISPNVSELTLNSVGLTDLHADYFGLHQTLKHLEFQDNYLEYIPTVPYSVEYLDLSGNNLSFVSARYLNYHSLKVLRISRMPSLTSIHHYAFYNLQSLETLVLSDCPNIQEFTDLAFGLASKTIDIHPKTLVLARNGITSLNSTYSHLFKNMQHIDLRHNPWDCNCDILWLQEFGADLFKARELRCAAPKNLRKKRILDLSHLDLQECFPEIYGKTSHRVTIVILTVIVIGLMGLIFYLIRYPKCWVNPKQIGVGPNSPYSRAPQDDGDVRF